MATLREAFELPDLRRTIKTTLENPSDSSEYWRIKFYPFDHTPDASYVFAATNNNHISVCRIDPDQDDKVEFLVTFDNKPDEQWVGHIYCALEWAFIDPDEPLLLGAGDSGMIQVYDVQNRCLKTSLLGHGQGIINDLQIHPKYPWIVASVSQDTSIRIWDLRRWNNKHESPCIVICGLSGGHCETLLTASWHDNGRYIVTGGQDHKICVWTIPDLSPDSSFWEEISPSKRKRTADEVRIVHYPHFVSSAIHSNFVDCVLFYGDLVLSKAVFEDKIVLWSIPGFNSRCEPPAPILAPKTEEYLETRNGFMKSLRIDSNGVHTLDVQDIYKDKLPYTRLLDFPFLWSEVFFINFGLIRPSPVHPNLHPILAIGNTRSEVYFWDLYALEHGYNPLFTPKLPKKKPTKKALLSAHDSSPSASNQSSLARDSFDTTAGNQTQHQTQPPPRPQELTTPPPPPPPPPADRTLFPLHLTHNDIDYSYMSSKAKPKPKPKPLSATLIHKIPDPANFIVRGVGWSPDGRYCVCVGEAMEIRPVVGKEGKGSKGKTKARTEGVDVKVGVVSVFGRWVDRTKEGSHGGSRDDCGMQ